MSNAAEMTDGFHLVVEALKLNGVDTIYGVAGIPITDLLRLAQNEGIRYFGFRHEQSAANAAAIAGYLTAKPGICMTVSAPGFLNGVVGARQRDDQLLSDDPDQRVERPRDRRSRTGRLRGDGPARRRPAALQGGLPRQPAAGYRHRHRAGDPRRGVGPAGRRLSRPDRRGARLARSTPRPAGNRWSRSSIPAPPSPPAPGVGRRARSTCWRSAQRPLAILGKGAAYARADARNPHLPRNRPASRSCRCRWPRASCPTTIRNRPPPPAPTRSATPMS